MNYVLQNVASEDMVQLFAPLPAVSGTPVLGLVDTDVEVRIRKAGATGYTVKTLVPADWVERGGGNYSIQFSASDFDTLGAFRYQVIAVGATPFIQYEDLLYIVEEIPAYPVDPPSINPQDGTPPGVSPDPVYQGSTLTISGSDLGGATLVTIGGVAVPITFASDSQLQVTVTKPDVVIGTDRPIVVETPGGQATAEVDVVLDPNDIPGSGMVNLYGFVHNPKDGSPYEGIAVYGKVLDMANIGMGVGWTDDTVTGSTDGNGRFDIFLPRGVRVEVAIPRIRYRRVFKTPDVATANIFTEIP